ASFALVLGGDLAPESVVPALAAAEARSPESAGAVTANAFEGRKVLVRTDGRARLFAGQAADGAMVFASDRALFEGAMPAHAPAYELAKDAEIALSASPEIAARVLKRSGGDLNPLRAHLGAIRRVSGRIYLVRRRAELAIEMSGPLEAA